MTNANEHPGQKEGGWLKKPRFSLSSLHAAVLVAATFVGWNQEQLRDQYKQWMNPKPSSAESSGNHAVVINAKGLVEEVYDAAGNSIPGHPLIGTTISKETIGKGSLQWGTGNGKKEMFEIFWPSSTNF